METKTPWKKYNDPNYINGEDLKESLRGLRPEMVVVIDSFKEGKTFDQKTQSDKTKLTFILKELDGKLLCKPMVLNSTNGTFLEKEFGSKYAEDFLGKTVVLYAKPDSRHGHVARFKKYYPPAEIKPERALNILSKCNSLSELQSAWADILTKDERLLPRVLAEKEKLKFTLK